MNERNNGMARMTKRFSASDMVIGSLMIAFGTLLLLHQLNIFYIYDLGIDSIWQLWPMIFVFVGIGKLADAPSVYHIGKGAWLIFVGVWLYVSINHVYGLSFGETWPAALIVWGISMMWQSFANDHKRMYQENNYGKQ